MANNRVFYACEQLGFALESTLAFTAAHGVQSCAITTNFNLTQFFELSQLAIYENKEFIPDVQFSSQKVLDGYPLLYHLATQGATGSTLAARGKPRCNIILGVFSDSQDAASGTPISEVLLSGMFVSGSSFNFGLDGGFTEDIQCVGNNKIWRDIAGLSINSYQSGQFLNNDTPLAGNASGNVNVRQYLVFGASGVAGSRDANGMPTSNLITILPPDIDGISASGTNDLLNNVFGAHIQSIQVNANLSRNDLNELGRKGPYFRYLPFPIQVTCAITANTQKWDNVSGTDYGISTNGNNLFARTIQIKTQEGTCIYLGTQNKIQSVDYNGGDTGGTISTVTYNYLTFNDYKVTHPSDPTVARRSD